MHSSELLNVTTHSGVARVLARTLESYGCDSKAFFREAGLESADTQTADARVAAVAMQKVWRRAVEETGDEAFGLRFAQNMHPAALQGLGFAWIASNSLRDAFIRLVRYYRIITTVGQVVLDEASDPIRLWYRIPERGGNVVLASLDAAPAVFIQMCRFTKGDDFCAMKVDLLRERPADESKFDAFFRCPINYGCKEICLYFEKAELEAPLPMANSELARANDQVVIEYLKRYEKNDIVNQVRGSIIDWLPSGVPSQESIAQSLHQSPRSLQRKLSAQGLTYKQLLEEIRSELARQYLKEPGRSVSEVAYLLGFTEPSNFARSFKRWTGQSPQAFQAH